MGRIVEAPTEADLADRKMTMRRAREIGMAMFQTAATQIVAETHPRLLKQLLNVTRRHALLFGDAVQRQVAVTQLNFDGLRDPVKIAGAGDVEAAQRRIFRKTRNHELGNSDFDRANVFVTELFEVVDDGMQESGEYPIDCRPARQRSQRQGLQIEKAWIENRLRYPDVEHHESIGQLQRGIVAGGPVEDVAQTEIVKIGAVIQLEGTLDRQCEPQTRRRTQARAGKRLRR